MAPFTISSHHPLSYQCHLPQTAPYKQSKMRLELSSNPSETPSDLPLIPYRRMSISSTFLKTRRHLLQVFQRVLNCCTSVIERFASKMFLFICVGKNTAMMGELKKNGVVEVQERPGGEFVKLDEKMMELEEGLTTSAERQEWSMEEDEDEYPLSEWESDEETDDEDEDDEDNGGQPPQEESQCDDDSEWSDDDDDSEASAENLEIWESFLKSSDPYNPLSFCSSIVSQTNNTSTNKNQMSKQTNPTPATSEEKHDPKPSTKSGTKVCFSDKIAVRPLVAWSFASRAARDGSCWMQMARDRERFRRRVESVEKVITPCFTPEHRADIWKRLERETMA